MDRFRLFLRVDDVDVEITGMHQDGTGTPVVFLHGFGSTKEDYADAADHPLLAGRPILAYEAPGCGTSIVADPDAVTIPFLVDVACAVLREREIDTFHLVGHSMGGLTGLLLTERNEHVVTGFVDIEGNLAPEDCFLSRQIVTHGTHTTDSSSADQAAAFLDAFADRAWHSRSAGSTLYASVLRHRVRPDVVRPIFTSMVGLSDTGGLLERFLALPVPRLFMYGEQNTDLSYLSRLAANGVELAEIPRSGHFPMYTNAPAMWDHIARFVGAAETSPAPSSRARR